jgi:hypothetical protein
MTEWVARQFNGGGSSRQQCASCASLTAQSRPDRGRTGAVPSSESVGASVEEVQASVSGSGEPTACEERRILSDCLGRAVTSVQELQAPQATSYGLRRLAVDLADGGGLDLLVKTFDVSPHTAEVTLSRGARERFIYEAVLAGRNLGTARLHGTVWDDRRSRHWLLLEFVKGVQLRHCMEDCIAAAGWLGRLQASVAGHEDDLARPGYLLRYDDAYFRETADRARQAVGSRFGILRGRLEGVLVGYESVTTVLHSRPPTLVHGSYRTSNVLFATRCRPPRVCVLDWELAAIGPPLHDLAFLADRHDTKAVVKMCRAYGQELAAAGHPVPDTTEMVEDINRLRLHKVLRSLARSGEWAYPIETVTKRLAQAEAIRRSLS